MFVLAWACGGVFFLLSDYLSANSPPTQRASSGEVFEFHDHKTFYITSWEYAAIETLQFAFPTLLVACILALAAEDATKPTDKGPTDYWGSEL